MKCDKHTMLLYAVTDRAWVGEQTLYQQVESALKGGATCVQLREKQLGDADFLQEAIQIHALCQQYGVPLFINDNVDVAVKCHAEGIHVGQDDMAAAQVRQRVGDGVMIGVSAHTVQEALDAVAHGADYLGVGAAFSTHTKTDVDVLPEGRLKEICDSVDVPVVAIGGIHKDNILKLKGSGADGVALARQEKPDAVLMDIHMPGKNGLQTTAEIRQIPGLATLPIIALTASALEGNRERLLYSTLPAGRRVFHLDFDGAGRLERVEQVLTLARFSGVALNTWTQADVERTFGPPMLVERVARFDGDIWTYRFMDDYEPRMAHIHIDRAGTVRQLVFSDDQPPGDDRDL